MSTSEHLKPILEEYGATSGPTEPYTHDLPNLQLFQILDGRFTLEEPLVDTVSYVASFYKGVDLETGNDVMFKVFAEPSPRFRSRVTREIGMHLLAGVYNSDNILPGISAGTVEQRENRYRYLVTPYCPEGTLPILAPTSEEELTEAVTRVGQIAKGLTLLHDNGLVHRDIKPSNSLIGPYGQMLISDLGIVSAPAMHNDAPGTLDYMSPEAYAGETHFSRDIYALGATLYACTTGKHGLAERLSSTYGSDELPTLPQRRVALPNVYSKILNSEVIPPKEFNPLIPDEVSSFTVELLDPSPTMRPTAEEALARLAVLAA
jgi:serine/threonine protein kinase